MEKREFLQTMCGLGMCACTGAILGPETACAANDNPELDETKVLNRKLNWRIDHAKRQFGMLLCKIEPIVPEERRKEILRDMGRNCAKALGWAKRYKGDPAGFFEHMKIHSGETLSFDESKQKILVVTRERNCDCPIVDSSKTPSYYCECSVGWQMETYETILGVPVSVVVKESVLRGSKRCVFEVAIHPNENAKMGQPI